MPARSGKLNSATATATLGPGQRSRAEECPLRPSFRHRALISHRKQIVTRRGRSACLSSGLHRQFADQYRPNNRASGARALGFRRFRETPVAIFDETAIGDNIQHGEWHCAGPEEVYAKKKPRHSRRGFERESITDRPRTPRRCALLRCCTPSFQPPCIPAWRRGLRQSVTERQSSRRAQR